MLPSQPAGTPWPTQEWPMGELRDVDRAGFDKLVGAAFEAKATPSDRKSVV